MTFEILFWLAVAASTLLSSGNAAPTGSESVPHSLNVSSCPGYTLDSLQTSSTGLSAKLNLAGPACNAFGSDIANLTIEVTYETQSRLHVNIFDTDNEQFRVPNSVVERPTPQGGSNTKDSDLVFNYDASPFAFWITRRSIPDAAPLFDTRLKSLPETPISPVNASDPSTAFDGFQLVFENQYLQLTSALPFDANVYGLGDAIASSGIRRDVGANGGNGTIQTMWARDVADPIDENMYGSHPVYVEHRFDEKTNSSQSHGVFLLSSSGMDVLLMTPPESNASFVQYRAIGGVLDLYFYSGPTPRDVIEQHGATVGFPTWQPYWGLGFHLNRWGYHTVNDSREQVQAMRNANIPLEVMWNDIDLYHAVRDFTSDPVSFPGDEMRTYIRELASNNQHYIPIVDAAIATQANASDIYYPYLRGVEQDVFVTNSDGSEYVGLVWPGFTAFPDWFANNTQAWWTEALRNWTESGIEFSGIWLDMNEASSFCDGSCGSGDAKNPGPAKTGGPVPGYPEGYNDTIWGPSGNITINGTLTFKADNTTTALNKRGLGAAKEADINLNDPPYAIHNGIGRLSVNTIATNATHAPGYADIDVHNMFGLLEERATHLAIQDIIPGKRPFLISRSTFPSAGKWTGHWLGDNFSTWKYMYLSIQGILQFQIFQIPMVGADTCGFNGNTDEELCNRWMQLAAFSPFYRNHNTLGALSQEPYRWDSVANASRIAIGIRYSLLPYWYTLFANSSMFGSPTVRALFWEFPDEPELFSVDRQFMVGHDILVTPVLTPNVSTVDGIFPGRGQVIWRDWYTQEKVDAAVGTSTTLDAPLSHINVHVRDGAAILLHQSPAYTIEETRQGPFSLLVSLSAAGEAFGTAFIDDGVSYPPGPNTTVTFTVRDNELTIASEGAFNVEQKLEEVTILGVKKPENVTLQGNKVTSWEFGSAQEKLVVSNASITLEGSIKLTWQ